MTEKNAECCPPFDPKPWDGKEIVWREKPFIKDRVLSVFHIPLNFGSIVIRNMKLISDSGTSNIDNLMLSDESSMWGSNVLIAVGKQVPGAKNELLSGTFITKVFEGDYKETGNWIKEMGEYVKTKNKTIKKLFFWYTTCPKCAKKYGKNYVVLFAQV